MPPVVADTLVDSFPFRDKLMVFLKKLSSDTCPEESLSFSLFWLLGFFGLNLLFSLNPLSLFGRCFREECNERNRSSFTLL